MEKISDLKTNYSDVKKSIAAFLIFTVIDVALLCLMSFVLFSAPTKNTFSDSGYAKLTEVETSPENDKRCAISFSAEGTAKNVFVTVSVKDFEFRTETFSPGEEFSFELCGYFSDEVSLTIHSGAFTKPKNESVIENGKAYAIIDGKPTVLSVYKVQPGNTVEFIATRHNRSAPAYKTSPEAIKAYNYIFDEEDFDSYYDEVVIPPSDFTSSVDTLPVAEDIPFDETEETEQNENIED